MAARATAYLASDEELLVVDLVIAEVVYVLESFYEVERSEVAQAVRSIVGFRSIRVEDADLILRSVDLYEAHRLDFADAYVAASAERAGVGRVTSFDGSLDRVGTIQRVQPACPASVRL